MADSKRFQAKNGLDNNNKTIVNVLDPVNNTDAVNLQYVNAAFQAKDADLTAIATLSDSGTGLLKKTAPNTWQLFTGTTLADYGITDAVSSSLVGAANGIATLGPDGTLTSSQIPAALLGSVSYKGVWNASTNTPTIPSASSTNKGWYYKVSVAGTTNIDGISDWQIGDWIISNGTTWDKIDNTDLVSSVNGLTGAVTLTTTNIAEGTQLYFTDSRVRDTVLTGYSIGSSYALSPTDTVLQAFNKLSFGVVSAHDSLTRTKKYHGMFYNPITREYDTSLSYTLATRTLTISPTGASYKIFIDGTQYLFNTPQQIQHPATEGGWFIYYTPAGVLTASQIPWNLLADVPVAYVYYDSSTPDFLLLDERHHHTSDKEWHNSQHFAYGTYIKNSTDFVLGNYTIGVSSNAAVTWSLGSGTIVDEDINTLVSAISDGGPYQTWYKSGPSGDWRRIQRSVPYHFNGTTNWAQYNAFTGGSWQLVDMANNQFSDYYIFAVPALDSTKQIVIVPSQTVYTSQSDAESESLASLDLTGFPSQEFVAVWKVVLRTDTSGGASGQAQIRSVIKLAGNRASETSGGASPTVHNALSGRSDPGTHPASSITNTPAGNIASLTVQAALNELDAEKGGLLLNNSWSGSNTFTQAITALQIIKSGGTSSQFLKADGSVDSSTYLTGNQAITLSGDATGSGTTAITVALSDTGVTDALLTNYSVGSNTALAATDTVLQAFQKIQGQLNNKQASGSYQPLDADLTAIATLAGTSGLLRKTAADTWSLDTSTYLTSNQSITISGDATGSGTTAITLALSDTGVTDALLTNYVVGSNTALASTDTVLQAFQKIQGQLNNKQASGSYQPLDADLTAIAGLAGTTGILRKTAADTWSLDTNTYLTTNQSISISGDATGSGTTAITLALSDTGVTDALLTNYVVGSNTALAATDTILQALQKIQGQLNNKQASGSYQPLDADLTAIAALAGTSGLLRKTATDTWSLDTNTYSLSSHLHAGTYEPVIAAGTSTQYYRGDKTWQTLNTAAVPESGSLYFTEARVRSTPLTGINTGSGGTVTSSDTVLSAIGKLEYKVSQSGSGLPSQTGNAGRVLTTDGTNASWSSTIGPLTITGTSAIPYLSLTRSDLANTITLTPTSANLLTSSAQIVLPSDPTTNLQAATKQYADSLLLSWPNVSLASATTPWQSYAPAWTSSGTQPSIGDGSITAEWRRVGNSLEGRINIFAGSSTTFGTGDYYLSIPSGCTIPAMSGLYAVGFAHFWDQSVPTSFVGKVVVQSSTTLRILFGQNFSPTIPATFTSGDVLALRFTVPIAEWSNNINLVKDFQEFVSCDGTGSGGGTNANTTYTPAVYTRSPDGSNFPTVTISSTTATTVTSYDLPFATDILPTDILSLEVNPANRGWVTLTTGVGLLAPYAIANGVPTGILVDRPAGTTNMVRVRFSNAGVRPGATYGTGSESWTTVRNDVNGYRWRIRKISNGNFAQGSPSYTTTIGNGSATTITVTHNLGTSDVDVAIWELAGNRRKVDSGVEIRTNATNPTTQVDLVFASAPALNSLRVTVFSNGGTSTNIETYSTSEILTSKIWINGKPLYRKVINLGNLPNATTKSVAHGVSGATAFVTITGYATNGSTIFTTLPHSSPAGSSFGIALSINGSNVDIVTGSDRSTWTGYAVLEYTK